MRILFLIGSYPTNGEGVADYLNVVSAECARLGHTVAIIALNDAYCDSQQHTRIAVGESAYVTVWRLPRSVPWSERLAQLRSYVQDFSPAWVSLQFVSYSFDRKGLVWNLGRDLRRIIPHSPMEIMFHEIWVGEFTTSSFKERCVGFLQRHAILRMLADLQPLCLHVASRGYLELLRREGLAPRRLPLCETIPVMESTPDLALSDDALNDVLRNREQYLIAVVLGSLHADKWDPIPRFARLLTLVQGMGKRLCVLSVGRTGALDSRWTQSAFDAEFSERLRLVFVGQQTLEKVSAFLRLADFSLGITPWSLVDKSAAVAVQLAHGLPVVVMRDDVRFLRIPEAVFEHDSRCISLDLLTETSFQALVSSRVDVESSVSVVVAQFLDDLQRAQPTD